MNNVFVKLSENAPERDIFSPTISKIFHRHPISLPHCAVDRVRSHFAMASLHSVPRFLLARNPILRRTLPLSPQAAITLRYASSSSSPKTLSEQFRRRQQPVIPQPDKYRPPSHGKRTPRSETANRSYGPKLTEEDKKRMRTKKYPNMMSPEGTFSHWFLNNKVIHLWITMVRSTIVSSCYSAQS